MEIGTFLADTHILANSQAAPAPPKQPPYNFSCCRVGGHEAPPSLEGEFHSTLCPNRMQVPGREWLLPLSPHRIPQTQGNSNHQTRRILYTYHAQASKCITSHPIITAPFEMGGIIVPISQTRKPRQTD